MLTIKLLSSAIALLISTTTLFVSYRKIIFNRKSRLWQEHEFIQKYLMQTIAAEEVHPLEIESGFYACWGQRLDAEEVWLLISTPNPTRAIKSYLRARAILKINADKDGFVYRDKYKDNKQRKIILIGKWAGYILSALLIYFPLAYAVEIMKEIGDYSGVLFIAVVVISAVALVILYLREIVSFASAEQFIEQIKSNLTYRPPGCNNTNEKASGSV